MSSKKARRRERREQSEQSRGGRLSPATKFILGIGLAILLVVAAVTIFGERPEPPYPGAVWSEAHGHWH